MNEENVLCAASSYQQKYYFNPRFDKIPDRVKKELQILCVSFTEEAGGILVMEFAKDGELMIRVQADDNDYLFDEIESGLRIRRMQDENKELFMQLETCYKVMFSNAQGSK
jgi:hypothetical protein